MHDFRNEQEKLIAQKKNAEQMERDRNGAPTHTSPSHIGNGYADLQKHLQNADKVNGMNANAFNANVQSPHRNRICEIEEKERYAQQLASQRMNQASGYLEAQ